MFTLAIGFGAGLIVGWNLLPQPARVKRAYDAVAAWWKSLGNARIDPFD